MYVRSIAGLSKARILADHALCRAFAYPYRAICYTNTEAQHELDASTRQPYGCRSSYGKGLG